MTDFNQQNSDEVSSAATGYWEKRRRDAERELVDAAIALDDQWKELGSCETTGGRVDEFVARFLEAVDAVRAEWSRSPDAASVAGRYPRATPRPWEALDAGGEPNVYPWVGWTDPDGQIVSVAETEDADAIDRDNVRLIVAAVNEYEALLALADAARKVKDDGATNSWAYSILRGALEALDAAS